jgi:hypothetical protein
MRQEPLESRLARWRARHRGPKPGTGHPTRGGIQTRISDGGLGYRHTAWCGCGWTGGTYVAENAATLELEGHRRRNGAAVDPASGVVTPVSPTIAQRKICPVTGGEHRYGPWAETPDGNQTRSCSAGCGTSEFRLSGMMAERRGEMGPKAWDDERRARLAAEAIAAGYEAMDEATLIRWIQAALQIAGQPSALPVIGGAKVAPIDQMILDPRDRYRGSLLMLTAAGEVFAVSVRKEGHEER